MMSGYSNSHTHSLFLFLNLLSAFPSNQQQNTFNAFPAASQTPASSSSSQNAFGAFGPPASASQPTNQASFAAFGGTTMTPTPATSTVNQASKSLGDLSLSNSSPSQGSNADKYSALSELDSIFSSNPSGVSLYLGYIK